MKQNLTYSAHAEVLGLKTSAIYARRNKGWCLNHATTVQKNRKPPVDCSDCTLKQSYVSKPDIAKIAQQVGVSRRAVYARLKAGWCAAHAANVSARQSPPPDCPDCKPRIVEDQHSLTAGTIAARKARGWSLQDAISKPLQMRGARRGHYKTPSDVLSRRRALGLNANIIASRVRIGWDRETAERKQSAALRLKIAADRIKAIRAKKRASLLSSSAFSFDSMSSGRL